MSADDLRQASQPLVQTMLTSALQDVDLLSWLDSRHVYMELRIGKGGVMYDRMLGGFVPYVGELDLEVCSTLREALNALQDAVLHNERKEHEKRYAHAFEAARKAQPNLSLGELDKIAKESM